MYKVESEITPLQQIARGYAKWYLPVHIEYWLAIRITFPGMVVKRAGLDDRIPELVDCASPHQDGIAVMKSSCASRLSRQLRENVLSANVASPDLDDASAIQFGQP
jgi:hypothetical protein